MVIVNDIFICKPGSASKLAKMFKESMAESGEQAWIMTDLVGQYNKVVVASQHENLAAYEKSFEKYMNPSEKEKQAQSKMAGYQDLYLSGSREIYKVW